MKYEINKDGIKSEQRSTSLFVAFSCILCGVTLFYWGMFGFDSRPSDVILFIGLFSTTFIIYAIGRLIIYIIKLICELPEK